MTTAIEYKTLDKVSPTGERDEFKVDVELTAAPSPEWVDEFTRTMNESPFCPNVEIDEKTVTFFASDRTIQRALHRLRTAIARTNAHLQSARAKAAEEAKDPQAEIRTKKAAAKEKQLKGEGF